MTTKQLEAIEEQIADSVNIIELDEVSAILFEDYFKSGKQKEVMVLHNKLAKRINDLAEFTRIVFIDKTTKPPRVVNEDPDPPKPKKNKLVKVMDDEDLLGSDDDDLLGESPKKSSTKKPVSAAKASGKPTTGKRVKALVESGKTDFPTISGILTKEGYTFSDNSVRWYISKAKKGEL